MFSKKRVLPFKSYFYFLPHLFFFADNKFLLFLFNAHKSNYINEGVKAKLAFSSSENNFLTTPSPSCLSPIIHSLLLNFLFNLVPRVLSYPPLRSERASERDPGWVWSRMPQSKINPERGVLYISIFCLFFCLSPYYWSKLPFSPFAMITRATLQSWHYSYNSTKTMGKNKAV